LPIFKSFDRSLLRSPLRELRQLPTGMTQVLSNVRNTAAINTPTHSANTFALLGASARPRFPKERQA
jgi:hypothetical protein